VDFYMKMLEDGEDDKKRGQVARNRRLAYLNRWAQSMKGKGWCWQCIR